MCNAIDAAAITYLKQVPIQNPPQAVKSNQPTSSIQDFTLTIKRESPNGKRTKLKPRLQVPYSKVCTIILHMQEDQSPYRSIGTSCTMVLCVTLCRHINTNSLRELHLSTDQCTTLCKLIQAHPPHTPTDPQAKYKFVHSDLNKSSLLSQVCFNSV